MNKFQNTKSIEKQELDRAHHIICHLEEKMLLGGLSCLDKGEVEWFSAALYRMHDFFNLYEFSEHINKQIEENRYYVAYERETGRILPSTIRRMKGEVLESIQPWNKGYSFLPDHGVKPCRIIVGC